MLEPELFDQLSCLNNEELSLDVYELSPFPAMDSPSKIVEFLDDAPVGDDNMRMVEFPFDEYIPLDFEELELIWRQEIQENCQGKIDTVDDEYCSLSPSIISSDSSINNSSLNIQQPVLIVPSEDIQISKQIILNNLASAYGEAIENKHAQLAQVIAQRIGEKVGPLGDIEQRILYYAFQPFEEQFFDHLKQESFKNIDRAFEAFYKIFPHGMIAHFTANSEILKAKPYDDEILHVVDFDIGEGAQWASLLMSLHRQQNEITMQQYGYTYNHLLPQQTILKLTAIKWREEEYSGQNNLLSWRRSEETIKRLQDCAKSLGIKLQVEEIELQELEREMKRRRKSGGGNEWLAFNCMWELPHMGRRRSGNHVMEFLTVAKDLLAYYSSNGSRRGILTIGEGVNGQERLRKFQGFGLFFESYMEHYKALLESIEWSFPNCFVEARLSMEFLFIAPYVSCDCMMKKWEEVKKGNDFEIVLGFEGLTLSNNSLMEAKEMVREGETPFGVRTEGENSNVLVLEWRGSYQLVRVSAWK